MKKEIIIPIFIFSFLLLISSSYAYYADTYTDHYAAVNTLRKTVDGNNVIVGSAAGDGDCLTVIDFNNDGWLDLIYGTGSISAYNGTVVYYQNNGDNTFKNPTLLTMVNGTTIKAPNMACPEVYDLTGHGYLDILLGDDTGRIGYYQNNGTNYFTFVNYLSMPNGTAISVTGGYAAPRVVDVNKDGCPDLLVGDGSGYIEYWQNDCTNHFNFIRYLQTTAGANIQMSGYYGQAKPYFVDFSGNGYLDMVVGDSGYYYSYNGNPNNGGYIYLYTNNGTWYFTSQGNLNLFQGPNTNLRVDSTSVRSTYYYYYSASPNVVDFDHSGQLSIVAGNWGGTVDFWKGLPMLRTPTTPLNWGTGDDAGGTLYDVNGDGYPDLIATSLVNNTVQYWQNNGSDYFTFTRNLQQNNNTNIYCDTGANGMGGNILITPFLGDSNPDILCTGSNGNILRWNNNGNWNFTYNNTLRLNSSQTAIATGGWTNMVGYVDMTNDGIPDLVAWVSGCSCFQWWQGTADGFFAYAGHLQYTNGTDIIIGNYGGGKMVDVNGDGYPDLVVGTNDGRIWILTNSGNSGSAYKFNPPINLYAGAYTNSTTLTPLFYKTQSGTPYEHVSAIANYNYVDIYDGDYDGFIVKTAWPPAFNITIRDQNNNLMKKAVINIYESGTTNRVLRDFLDGGIMQAPLNHNKVYDVEIQTNTSNVYGLIQNKSYQQSIWFKNVRSPDNITVNGNFKWAPLSTWQYTKNFTAGHIIPVEIHILDPYPTIPISVYNISITDTAPTNTAFVSGILVELMNSTGSFSCGTLPTNSTYYYIDKTTCSFLSSMNSTNGDHIKVSYRIRVQGPSAYSTVGQVINYTIPNATVTYDTSLS